MREEPEAFQHLDPGLVELMGECLNAAIDLAACHGLSSTDYFFGQRGLEPPEHKKNKERDERLSRSRKLQLARELFRAQVEIDLEVLRRGGPCDKVPQEPRVQFTMPGVCLPFAPQPSVPTNPPSPPGYTEITWKDGETR